MSVEGLVKEVPTAKAKSETIDGIDRWKVENAAETLQRAEDIQQDKKLFAAAKKVLMEKQKAIKRALDWADNL